MVTLRQTLGKVARSTPVTLLKVDSAIQFARWRWVNDGNDNLLVNLNARLEGKRHKDR